MADPEREEASVVVVGNFNPAIFHPSWLAAQGIVGKEEAASASVGLIHPSLTSLVVGSLRVDVTPERLDVRTEDMSSQVVLRDFLVSVLGVLEHTPVSAFGINRAMHQRVDSEDEWHRIGHTLAPKAQWFGLVDDAGMQRVTIRGKRPGCTESALNVGVEPSAVVTPGVFFQFNEHFARTDASTTTTFVRDGLMTHWDAAQAHFLIIAREIVSRTKGHA